MNTNKAVSTISFNSKEFLIANLNQLIDSKIICFYAFIKHKAEPKENNDTLKAHFHVYIEPNKRIDTMELGDMLKEFEASSKAPLGCLPFTLSKFSDWYYYALHNPKYLASKGMNRKYAYDYDEIITSSPDYLKEKVNSISLQETNCYKEMKHYLDNGYDFNQYAITKNISPMQLNGYSTAWKMVEEVRIATKRKKKKKQMKKTSA